MEETVCLTCGDPGWSVALIYCDECQELAVHRYCLKTIPKTFDEYVVWHCDDCKPELPLIDGVGETISILPDEPSDLDLPLVDFLHAKNKKHKKTQINNNKNKKKKKNQQVVLDNDDDPQEQEIPLSPAKTNSREIAISDGDSERSSCMISSKDEFEDEPVTHENEVDWVAVKSELSPLPKLDSSMPAYNVNYVPAQPIIDPIWRGCLNIMPEQNSCQVVAHVSNLACEKVSAEAKLLPEILSSELHPRTEVWPQTFEEQGLSDESIGVYIFAESEKDEKVFRDLIGAMIRNDSALRAIVTHAELLVFASTKLPLRLWKFQTKLYLWGVFRAKQAPSEVFNPCSPHAEVLDS